MTAGRQYVWHLQKQSSFRIVAPPAAEEGFYQRYRDLAKIFAPNLFSQNLGRLIMEEVTGGSLQKMLESQGILSKEALEKAESFRIHNNLNLEQALLELKLVDLKTLGGIFEKQFSIRWVDLKNEKLESRVVGMIPENIMREKRVLAFRHEGKVLHVAMADPRDQATVDRLQILTGCSIKPYLADLKALGPALRKFVPDMSEAKARIQEIARTNVGAAAEDIESGAAGHDDVDALGVGVEEALEQ